jgi:hypothetical protein
MLMTDLTHEFKARHAIAFFGTIIMAPTVSKFCAVVILTLLLIKSLACPLL